MPTVADWSLLVVVVAGLGVRAWYGMRRLRGLGPAEAARERPRLWLRGLASQWALVALLAALWVSHRRPFASLGLGSPAPWGLAGVGLGLALIALMVAAQRRQVASRPELAARVRDRLASVSALMPHDRAEFPGFVSLAITAGVCEELLFRGFVSWVLACVLPAFWMAALGQAILFGLAHAYQGPRGVLATAAVGVFMAGIVWVTGSLWAAMLVHALMDINAGDMALLVFAEPPAPAGT
jgi:membrane protease YdiL (CAAX protease family)